MDFSNTTTKNGLLQDCEIKVFGDEGYGKITGDSNLLLQFTNRINRAFDRYVFLAMSADGRWQWDDNNYTDMSIGLTNIVATQRTYTFALEHLEIEKVLVADSTGNWHLLTPIDEDDRNAIDYLENNGSRTGIPTRYDKRGDTIFLDVTPNYSYSNGLKVFFKRGPSYFVSTDTTKVAGFASIFHPYLPLHASMTYTVDRTMPQAKNLFDLVTTMERDIQAYYGRRNKDEQPRIRPAYQNNK